MNVGKRVAKAALIWLKKVVELLEGPKPTPKFVYDLEDSLEEKVNKIVKTIYGGDGVIFTDKAKKQIKQLADWGP